MAHIESSILECIKASCQIFLLTVYFVLILVICIVEMRRKKICVVHKYLEDRFPGCKIRVGYDFDRMAPRFQVYGADGTYCMVISKGFFSNHKTQEIKDWLRTSKLSTVIVDYGNSTTTVNPEGCITLETETEISKTDRPKC